MQMLAVRSTGHIKGSKLSDAGLYSPHTSEPINANLRLTGAEMADNLGGADWRPSYAFG